jgi:DNA polymerase elongation subunit (family B)
MFKNIYVNRKDNSFTLWETDGSKKTHKFKCRSWIENPGIENSSYRTIDDIPVMPVLKTCQDERFDVTNGNLRCEADIQPEIRILSEYYEKEETLDFHISDFNILSFDIEVENGSGFPEPEKAERRVNVISCYSTKYKKFMIFSLNSVNRNRFHELVVDRAKAFEDIFEENSKTDKKGVLKEYFKSLDIVNNYIVIECPDEETLLSKFYVYCEEVRPDIYTGWNCIDANSSLWLKDRIIKISDVNNLNDTFLDGKVVRNGHTGLKQSYKISTTNGYYLNSSKDHVFPIKYINKSSYIDSNSKSIISGDYKVEDIAELLDNNRVFMRVDIRNNTNCRYTYRNLIEYILKNNKCKDFNVVLPEPIYARYRSLISNIFSESISYQRCIQYPYKYSLLNIRKYINISDEEILNELSDLDYLTILYNKSNVVINLNDAIANNILWLLGLIYTDGAYDRKRNNFSIYNTDNILLDNTLSVLHSEDISNTNSLSNGNKCKRIRFSNSAFINMLSSFIYNANKMKDLNLECLSRLSNDQFSAFYSGLLDGNGCLTQKSINFCNYNNDDIFKIGELLQWNGVLCSIHENNIRINNRIINYKFIKSLKLKSNRNNLLANISLHDDKDSKSKARNYIFYEDCYYVVIDKIELTDNVNMFDIETDTHYFNTSFGIKTHNCNSFDLPYLINRSKKLLVYEYTKLSPVGKVYLSQKKNEQFRTMELVPVICGASCIDYLPLYKEFNKGAQKINYKLDTIANDELKIGKVKLGDSGLSLAEKDWDSFCVYNLVDSVLVVLLEPQLQLIESLIGTCSEARIPLEYFFISKRVILGFMMTYMHRKGLVIPFTKNVPKEPYEGAYIKMNPRPYKYVASFDAKAMYPSIMISCNISPETKVVSTVELLDCCKSVIKNIYYTKEKQGIIPEIVSFIVDSRDEFKRLQKVYSNPEKKEYDPNKKALYERKQKAYKIFANSVYGLLGNNYFQLYDVHNAASITGIGNKLIQHVINYTVAWMDNKLPTNENFKKEFGEYANVTIKGKLNDSYIKSFDESERSMLGVYKRLVLAHTDSFFFDYSDLYSPFENRKRTWEEYIAIKERFTNTESPSYNKALASYFKDMNDRMWDTMTFTEFMLRFDYCVFEKIMSQITHKWSTMYNYREDRMWFKLEKCCTNLIALTKAHYICYLEYDEGDLLLHQPFKKRLKAVGVEMIKSDTPQWSKDKIMETLEQMFTKGNRNDISKYIGLLNKDYRDPKNLARISRPASINSLGPTLANTYPAPRMGSIIWNKILDEDSDFANYEPISEGTKIRWIAVKQPNKFNIPAISYNCEEYPQELKKYFIIDHDTQFKKTFRTPLEKIFEIYGWGNIFDGNVESIRRYFKQKG